MWNTIHQFLKWMPTAIVGFVLASSASFEYIRDRVGEIVPEWWRLMADPLIAFALFLGIITYVATLVATGFMAAKSNVPTPKFRGEIDSVGHLGELPEHPEMTLVVLNCTVRNIGTLPSVAIANRWRVWVGKANDERLANIVIMSNPFIIGSDNDRMVFPPERSILRRMETIVSIGDVAQGHLFCLVPNYLYREVLDGKQILVSLEDVMGKASTFLHRRSEKNWKRLDKSVYIPGTGT